MTSHQPHRTDWLHAARWGVSMHFIPEAVSFGGDGKYSEGKLSAQAWNRRVDNFDAAGLASQLAEVGAGYFMLTIGQNSGFYCAPNATYDEFVGRTPSRCSQRDLIADVADALAAHGISMAAYLPSNAPEVDTLAKEKLDYRWGYSEAWPSGWRDELRTGERSAEFQIKWQAVIREWSLRWGGKLRGWWFDGCYFADAMYRHEAAPNFHSFAAAARAGNPIRLSPSIPGSSCRP